MTVPKHPEVMVKLVGGDGNAFTVLGHVIRAMRIARLSDLEIARFRDEATAGDYDHLLSTVMAWVEVE
jgi:hypothetical protein